MKLIMTKKGIIRARKSSARLMLISLFFSLFFYFVGAMLGCILMLIFAGIFVMDVRYWDTKLSILSILSLKGFDNVKK